MSLRSVEPLEAAHHLGDYDAVLDARSPSEFAEDHLPGAENWPVLDDAQRAVVGTLYVQQGPLPARKLGAALAARNIADHLERWIGDKPREWRPLVYCWRGGQRSGSLAWFLDQIGFRTTRLAGGYKGFRGVVRQELEQLPARLDFTVLAGRTGCGKTRLLQALAQQGAQVIDLEGLACHRGSILGGVPGQAQPSQKRFDTLLWQALRQANPARPVFVESESKRIGRLQLPDALVQRWHEQGRVVQLELPDEARLDLLQQDYGHFSSDAAAFCRLLDGLVELRGRDTVTRWQAMARAGDWPGVFGALMHEHYDPLYRRSIERHYAGRSQPHRIELPDPRPGSFEAAARTLLA